MTTYTFFPRPSFSSSLAEYSGQTCTLLQAVPPVGGRIHEYLVQFAEGRKLFVWEDELTPHPIDVPSPRLGQRSKTVNLSCQCGHDYDQHYIKSTWERVQAGSGECARCECARVQERTVSTI